jgi:hypothetical protein
VFIYFHIKVGTMLFCNHCKITLTFLVGGKEMERPVIDRVILQKTPISQRNGCFYRYLVHEELLVMLE